MHVRRYGRGKAGLPSAAPTEGAQDQDHWEDGCHLPLLAFASAASGGVHLAGVSGGRGGHRSETKHREDKGI